MLAALCLQLAHPIQTARAHELTVASQAVDGALKDKIVELLSDELASVRVEVPNAALVVLSSVPSISAEELATHARARSWRSTSAQTLRLSVTSLAFEDSLASLTVKRFIPRNQSATSDATIRILLVQRNGAWFLKRHGYSEIVELSEAPQDVPPALSSDLSRITQSRQCDLPKVESADSGTLEVRISLAKRESAPALAATLRLATTNGRRERDIPRLQRSPYVTTLPSGDYILDVAQQGFIPIRVHVVIARSCTQVVSVPLRAGH